MIKILKNQKYEYINYVESNILIKVNYAVLNSMKISGKRILKG
jgi:hypothetical protein